jgi:HYR domain
MSRSRRAARGRLAARLAVVVPLGLLAAYGVGDSAASALPSNCSQTGSTVTCTFGFTGTPATWTVPTGVKSAGFTLYGGSGAAGSTNVGVGGPGGAGAEVTGTVSLSGVSSLTVNVAGSGAINGTGGYGGGGESGNGGEYGGGGGGATTVSDSAGTLLIAGGGGGGGMGSFDIVSAGGTGGNADTAGQSGQAAIDQGATLNGGGGGGAGTQTAGGAGGTGGSGMSSSSCFVITEQNGNPGSSGQGGGVPPSNDAGAGGGGGLFGGGQGGEGAGDTCFNGAAPGGGGGGSSFTGGQGVSGAAVNDNPGAPASLAGNGEVIITYADADLAIATHANITGVDATGPSGATVTYTAPAVTDGDDASPPAAVCTPKPGSVFPIGTTTVTCTATDTDDANSPVSASFTVTVEGAVAQLADLYQAVQNVRGGKALARTVARAERQAAGRHPLQACQTLNLFILEVQLETPWRIPADTSAQLVAAARQIEAVLGCSGHRPFPFAF